MDDAPEVKLVIRDRGRDCQVLVGGQHVPALKCELIADANDGPTKARIELIPDALEANFKGQFG